MQMRYTAGTISEMCKKMEALGVAEGGSLRPDTAAVAPDLNEIKVITKAKQCVSAEDSALTDAFVDAEKKIRDIDQKVEVIEASCNAILDHELLDGAYKSALSKDENKLVAACAKELESKAALNSFKTRNEISDPARYPSDQLFHFSLLILFVAIETAVNAFFYQGSSGLLGGAVVALAVAFVNMGIAAALGSMYRYTNLKDTKDKITGYSGLIAFIILAVVLNLIFSTFRVQYELVQAQVLQDNLPEPTTAMLVIAFKTAVADAFKVFVLEFPDIDVMSFILFFVGILCSIIAFWKGYTHDDKHPHYGEMDRDHKKAESEFQRVKQAAFDSAVAKVHEVADEVEASRNELVAAQRNSNALKAQIQGAQATYDGNVRKIQGELNLVLEAYRGANKATRTTNAPKYFDDLPSLASVDDGKKLIELINEVEKLTEKAKGIADSKVSELSNKLHGIRSKINQLVQAEFQKYMNEIVDKATVALRSNGQVNMVSSQ